MSVSAFRKCPGCARGMLSGIDKICCRSCWHRLPWGLRYALIQGWNAIMLERRGALAQHARNKLAALEWWERNYRT